MDDNLRLRLKDIKINPIDGGQQQVVVKLSVKEREYQGSAAAAQAETTTAAVQATLAALSEVMGKKFSFTLIGIDDNQTFEGLDDKVVVVVVSVNDGESETVTPGSCRVTDNNVEAAVKATLDATNRIVEMHLQ